MTTFHSSEFGIHWKVRIICSPSCTNNLHQQIQRSTWYLASHQSRTRVRQTPVSTPTSYRRPWVTTSHDSTSNGRCVCTDFIRSPSCTNFHSPVDPTVHINETSRVSNTSHTSHFDRDSISSFDQVFQKVRVYRYWSFTPLLSSKDNFLMVCRTRLYEQGAVVDRNVDKNYFRSLYKRTCVLWTCVLI